ncbi:MAG: hypothetical protein H7245_18140 [Candidatus Saccharibacteria bacterium]|nr:hypothetical protein [Pseudorhodobacter sp.]
MQAISSQHTDFAARVARVENNLAGARQLLFVGVDEVYSMPRRERKARVSGVRTLLNNALYPVSMVAAVILGAVSHCIGQIARFHVQGVPDLDANPDIEMLKQVILGIVIAIALGYVFRLQSRSFMTLKSSGVVIGVLFMHNLVHLYPRLFAQMTSALWVNQVVSHTSPYSMLWRGISFVF